MKHKYNTSHGSPYDRGSADAYYRRARDPHWYPAGSFHGKRIGKDDMTTEEIDAYNYGFDNEADCKEW